MKIDSSQNVGIGTTSPASELHIGTGNTARHIKVSDSRAMFGYDGANAVVQGGNTKGIEFNTGSDTFNTNTRMTITADGDVGIGTTSPEDLLHIHSTGDTTVRIKSTANKSQIRYQNDTQSWYNGIASDESLFWYGSEIAGTAGFIQSSTGNLYWNQNVILSTNAKYLHSRDASGTLTRMFGMNASNNTYIGPIDSYAGGSILYGASSNVADQIFYTSGSERLRIDSQGNLKFSENGTNPSAAANTAFMFNDGGELKVLDELGNTTTISPHNFDLIPGGASEDRAWGYYSEKDIKDEEGNVTSTQKVNVDMMKLARLVEQLTGEKLVYTEEDE